MTNLKGFDSRFFVIAGGYVCLFFKTQLFWPGLPKPSSRKRQCFSYRRFLASRDARSSMRTQVERFDDFFVHNFDANL